MFISIRENLIDAGAREGGAPMRNTD